MRLDMKAVSDKLEKRGGSATTANVNDFAMVGENLARVVVSFTGSFAPREMHKAIAELFDNEVSAIPGSFRTLKSSPTVASAVGFIVPNKIVVPYTEASVKNMTVMASNVLMDAADNTIWRVRESGNQKFICKDAEENLAELVSLARVRNVQTDKLTAIASASCRSSDYVAFADAETASVGFGFVVESDANLMKVQTRDGGTCMVANDSIIEAATIGEADFFKEAAAKSGDPADDLHAYYAALYGNIGPEYLDLLDQSISDHAFA